jgi:hypothetical protein
VVTLHERTVTVPFTAILESDNWFMPSVIVNQEAAL